MSGGHWGYMANQLEERAKTSGEVWRLLAALEYELDRGICCDTCPDCAKKRAAEALCAFFDAHCADATVAIAIARDDRQHNCERCKGRR